MGASYSQGVALARAGSTAEVFVPAPEQRPQKNVIAELPGGLKLPAPVGPQESWSAGGGLAHDHAVTS